ncbi:MAG: hypothetical protein HOI07_05990 [Betaproteobacteria bacterium]|jgi:hypothetical protein|nr:hypothetical protein [Betaproteobacteria bacterium]
MGLFKDCGCGCDGKKQEQKLLISIMSALVFFIIANPDTFRIMRKVFGSWVSSPTGCPSISGLALHTVVFMLVTWGMMNVKTEAYEPDIGPAPMPESDAESDDESDDESDAESESDDESDAESDDEFASIAPGPMDIGPSPMLSGVDPVVRMADVEPPKPYMKEKPIEIRDSGRVFTPMDINSGLDAPAPISFKVSKKAKANCKLEDGTDLVFN